MSHLNEDQLAQLNQVRTAESLHSAYLINQEKKSNCGKCKCKIEDKVVKTVTNTVETPDNVEY